MNKLFYKQDVLYDCYEYKNQMRSERLTKEKLGEDNGFDFGQIKCMKLSFDSTEDGEVIIDNVGIYIS